MSSIAAVKMPKWGLSMQEGKVVHWWKHPGEPVREGEDLVDIETSKITNTAEAQVTGVVRRLLAEPDETLPVGALLAVVSDEAASEAEIDAFVAAFQENFTPETVEAEGDGALALRTIDVGGRGLRVGVVSGEGAPIVLLHGFGADLNNWLFNLDALSAAGPVIAIDLPGHGGSDKDVGDGSLQRLAGDVARALDALGVDRAHLVGHSLGAAVATRLALDRPGLARSLTLISPAGLPGSRISRDFLDGFVAAERARDLKPVLEMLVADPGLISRDMVDDVLKFKRLDGAEEALAILRDRMIDGADFRALQSRLADLPPALVIASRSDAVIEGLDEAALPPGWRVAWIEGAGHVAHLERAGEVNALILNRVNGQERKTPMQMSRADLLRAWRLMVTIRLFEERVEKEFAAGNIPGFCHLYLGQEASGVGVCFDLTDEDWIGSTHRGHGHCIAKGCDVTGMMLEIMGKAGGLGGGKGGSMHIADMTKGMLGANGIVGGSPPIAVGAALTQKLKQTGKVAVAFTGDGASNQGTTFEAMNMAVVLGAPAIFAIEANGYGEFTATSYAVGAPSIAERARSFGMPAEAVDATDFFAVREAMARALDHARGGQGPYALELVSARFMGHFVGDPQAYRSAEELARVRANDPLTRFRHAVTEASLLDDADLDAVRGEVADEIDAATAAGIAGAPPPLSALTTDVYVRYPEGPR